VILVLDASALVASLVDSGPDGDWVADVLRAAELAAPDLMPVEAANILRRAAQAGDIESSAATLAHGDLLDCVSSSGPTRRWRIAAGSCART
jgi:predicted nucleic acid-binding protein